MKPKSSQVFYRSALATAVIMALSGPAMADNGGVTLNNTSPTLGQDVTTTGGTNHAGVTVAASNGESKNEFSLGGKNVSVTADSNAVTGVKLTDADTATSGVTIDATGSTVTATSTASQNATALSLGNDKSSTVTVNGGKFVAAGEGSGVAVDLGNTTAISSGTVASNITFNDSSIAKESAKGYAISSKKLLTAAKDQTTGVTDNISLKNTSVTGSSLFQAIDSDKNSKLNGNKTYTANLNLDASSVDGSLNVKATGIQGKTTAALNATLDNASSLKGNVNVTAVKPAKTSGTSAASASVTLKNGSSWDGNIAGNTTTGSTGNPKTFTENQSATVSLSDSTWKGNVGDGLDGGARVTLKNSSWTGDVSNAKTAVVLTDGSVWNGAINSNPLAESRAAVAAGSTGTGTVTPSTLTGQTVALAGSTWNVTGDSSVQGVTAVNSTISVKDASLTTQVLSAKDSNLVVDAGTTNALNVTGKATGNVTVYNAGTVDLKDAKTAFITVGEGSDLKAKGTTEGGLYQYDLEQGADGNFYFVKNESQLSNASSVIQAMAAAPANVANLQADTLSARQDAARLSANDDGGVWVQYFGGKQKHTTAGNAAYNLDVNGVMVGGDTRVRTDDGSWLAGVAMSSAKGDMTTMQSKGDTEGYSFHAYLSRQYNNGFFVDTAAQFGHYSNTADVRIANGGGSAKADFNTNGFGAMVKGGYTWKDGNGLFVQPYAKLSALTLEGVDYQLNGVDVHSDSYNSVLGEAGTRVGYDFAVGNATVKPYLNLAALNEFSDGNKVRLGDESVNASIDGAAFRVGAGVQADITKNVGAFASLGYTKGNDVENPLQGLVGVNVTW